MTPTPETTPKAFPEIKLAQVAADATELVRAEVPIEKLIDTEWIDRAFQPIKTP